MTPSSSRGYFKLLRVAKDRIRALNSIKGKSSYDYFRTLLRHDLDEAVVKITGVPVRGLPMTDALASHTMCVLHAYFVSEGKEGKQSCRTKESPNGMGSTSILET